MAFVACSGASPGSGDTVDFVGGFSASFPLPPVWHHAARGTTVDAHAVKDRHALQYTITYDLLPTDMSRREGVRVVEVTRDELVRGAKSPVVAESAISLGDVPGHEVVFTLRNGDTAVTHIYATTTHVYEVTATGPDTTAVTAFLDSFRLIDK